MTSAHNSLSRNAPCPCGSGKKLKKCCIDTLQISPISQPPLKTLLNQAIQAYSVRDFNTAVSLVKKILERNPKNGQAWQIYGCVLMDVGDFKQAEIALIRATEYEPKDFNICHAIGELFKTMHRYSDAMTYYHKAIALAPKQASMSYLGLAYCYQLAGAIPQAQQQVSLAKKYISDHPLLWKTEGAIHTALRHHSKALACFEKVLEHLPHDQETLFNIAILHYNSGCFQPTDKALEALYNAHPLNIFKIQRLLQLPQIPESEAHIKTIRHQFEKNIDTIAKLPVTLSELSLLRFLPYYHIYHGKNDAPLLAALANAFEKACPDLLFTAPHCTSPKHPKKERKIRIGFVSEYFVKHAQQKSCDSVAKQLANHEEFEVHLLSTSPDDAHATELLKGCHLTILPKDLNAAHRVVSELELDAIHYTHIGMNPFLYFLAFARLAPLQTNGMGHPETSGIASIDYYLSYQLFEPSDAKSHYTEELHCLKNGINYVEPIEPPQHYLSRAELSLPEDKNIYLCPMIIHKIHPEYDQLVADILKKDEHGVFVFFIRNGVQWHLDIQSRLSHYGSAIYDRVLFLPEADNHHFMSALKQADAVIDTLHFGGGSTFYISFNLDVPVITYPTEFARGRIAAGIYKLFNMEEMTADSFTEYVDLAYKMANDTAFRQKTIHELQDKKQLLFRNQAFIDELAQFFLSHALPTN